MTIYTVRGGRPMDWKVDSLYEAARLALEVDEEYQPKGGVTLTFKRGDGRAVTLRTKNPVDHRRLVRLGRRRGVE